MRERDKISSGEDPTKSICARVPARRDLLDFVAENLNSNIYKDLGKNPRRWIEELGIISGMLTGEGLVSLIDIDLPPLKDNSFKEIGDNVFVYKGEMNRLRGIWISDKVKNENGDRIQWTHLKMGMSAKLCINREFSDIPIEAFLPENFEKRSVVAKEGGKRPILKFSIPHGRRTLSVFAKGAFTEISLLVNPPSYRLTNICEVVRVTSERERDYFEQLKRVGVNTPNILGYYKGNIEEFLFVEEVNGGNPIDYLENYREAIIKQDAYMLAQLCLLGLRKHGFTDFDDKIFNGKQLYLIDVDELVDLYFECDIDFKKILLNPHNKKGVEDFRKLQRSIFERILQDTIFSYKETLTTNLEEQTLYIKTFFNIMKWEAPNEKTIKNLTSFSGDYLTMDSYFSMVMDN